MNKALILFLCIGIIFATSMARESHSRPAIGGGDHDIIAYKIRNMKNYLNEKSVDQLKTEALKMEAYVNKKSGHMILGGLHDYIESLSKEELVQVMSKMMLNNLELLDVVMYESVISPEHNVLSFLAEVPQKVGGLHDYIFTIDEDTLRTWAIAVDRYHSEKNGEKPIGGGIHDRLRTMKKLDFIEYILKMIRQYPNLDSSIELNQLCVNYGISKTEKKEEKPVEEENHTMVGGLVDYIWRQSDQTLIHWALTADKYDKEKRNVHLLGGLDDYVDSLSREKLMEIILKHAKTYPELNSNVKLDSLAATYGFFKPEKVKEEEAPMKVGGLTDYIWRQPEDVLRQWALTCEKYETEKKNLVLIGGLHDYVDKLTKEELIKIILQYTRNYSELDSGVRLNELALSYGFTAPQEETPIKEEKTVEEENHTFVGGLVDYIWRQSDETLIQWALTADKYDKEKRNVHLLGGLEDYVYSLSREKLMEITLNHAKTYPELNSNVKLNALATSYGITQPENKNLENAGGLEDYVWRMPDETLRDWALTCEKYDRETRKVQLDGGLHDYINVLNKEQIVEIIMKHVKTYPELNSGVKLTELSMKYGFTPNEGTQKPPEPVAVGGLHDYIWQVRDDILFSWALTCDKYDRQVRNVKLLGGLVDYVRLLKKEELIKIILDFTGKYPELNSASKLQELAISYGIEAPEN